MRACADFQCGCGCVTQEYGLGNRPAPKAPAPIAAMLKMRCETSGSDYAMFWQQTARGLEVAGGYVTPERKAALRGQGKVDTYADACSDVVLDASGSSFVAKALRSREHVYIQDANTCATFARRDKAADYGIRNVCMVAAAGGVIEYGTSKAYWSEAERSAAFPGVELESAVKSGASFVLFWRAEVSAGDREGETMSMRCSCEDGIHVTVNGRDRWVC